MFRGCFSILCAGFLACNGSDAVQPVTDGPGVAPADGMGSAQAPAGSLPWDSAAEPSSAAPEGPSPSAAPAGAVPAAAAAAPEEQPVAAPLDPNTDDGAEDNVPGDAVPGDAVAPDNAAEDNAAENNAAENNAAENNAAENNAAPTETPPVEEAAAGPIDTTPRTVNASDPNIQYFGRIDFSDPAVAVYAAPGVTVTARFRGDAISALLGDEFRYGSERSFHDVIVDGQLTRQIAPEGGVGEYELASGLTPGEHTVSIVKRTQAMLGKALFRGFKVGGQLMAPPERPALKIEFIGDSITAGEGADAVNGSPDCKRNAFGMVTDAGWGQPFHDANASYGVVTARALGAEYHLTAVSGIGLVRNYSTADTQTMPVVYDRIFVEEPASPLFDHARFVPDIVVIALGTNDFSGGNAPRPNLEVGTYTNAYAQFISRVRNNFPNAEIFALTSQLLAGAPANDLRSAVAGAVQRANASGDTKVHSFVTAQVGGQGCTGHPNAAQHAQLAAALTTEIRAVLGL
jgi:lysophospholipase L1-like esterase